MRLCFSPSLRFAFLLTATSVGTSSFGILATTSTTLPPDADVAFPYVGSFGFNTTQGSGVAIGPNLVLTAAHNTITDFTLNGTTYGVLSYVDASSYGFSGLDLRIVTLNKTLPGFYPIGTSVALGSTITMVGYGFTGVVDGDHYTPTNFLGRHAGTNLVDDTMTNYGGGPGLTSFLRGPGSAIVSNGDSGGGWFQNGSLVGISDALLSTTGQPTYKFAVGGTAYSASYAINLTSPEARSFITQAVPEPATVAALGLAAVTCLRRRKKA